MRVQIETFVGAVPIKDRLNSMEKGEKWMEGMNDEDDAGDGEEA